MSCLFGPCLLLMLLYKIVLLFCYLVKSSYLVHVFIEFLKKIVPCLLLGPCLIFCSVEYIEELTYSPLLIEDLGP